MLRWLQLTEFDRAYREARRVAFSQSIARLQQASSAAAATLLKIMVDPTAPAASRIRAADSVLGHAAKAIEIEDIEARVSELERTAESSKDGRRAAPACARMPPHGTIPGGRERPFTGRGGGPPR